MSSKTCLIIAGPTAAGKTALAVELARRFDTAIISADSRQCFRELNIGVAKPSQRELEAARHYFINTHSIEEDVNAATFENYALNAAAEIFEHRDIAIMTGGTGLYIRAFCEGMDNVPVIAPEVRNQVIAAYEKYGIEWLQDQIASQDPLFSKKGDLQNPQRLMRALEVVLSTGKSIYSFHTGEKKERNFRILKAGITLPREELYERINLRVDAMVREGLVEEVKSLWPYRRYNALQTVGYTELFNFFEAVSSEQRKITGDLTGKPSEKSSSVENIAEGNVSDYSSLNALREHAPASNLPAQGNPSIEQAIELIKQNTRRYAKRQMTWFRKDPDIHWFPSSDPAPVAEWFLKETGACR